MIDDDVYNFDANYVHIVAPMYNRCTLIDGYVHFLRENRTYNWLVSSESH